ncbi:diguanylate cyclase [Sphingomonas baiyangensis]|uniref:diguanylate cyclase n=2 Tax=Sphingomonas baiyangensis TaxID=2572576 RepID=A0A4U1LAB0_9SPHN|nr:diguanylate cyclase [Sphingomonas baiyangensis]
MIVVATLLAMLGQPAAARANAAIGTLLPVCIAPAQAGTIADVAAGRLTGDCRTEQTRFGEGDFWAIAPAVPARAAGSEPIDRVRIGSLWQESVSLFVLYADGHLVRIDADQRGISRRIQLGARVEFRLPLRAAAPAKLAWLVEGSANRRGILMGAELLSHDDSAHANLALGAMYALFAGLCIALIVYNLALWGALRHRFQLAYCLMVAMLLAYAGSSSGALAWLWPKIANNDRLRINYVTLAGAAAAALWFVRSFFEPRVFAGIVGKAIDVAIVLLAAAGLAFALGSHWWMREFDLAYTLSFGALLSLVPLVLWRAWRARSDYLWLFAIAWAAPVAMAALRVAHNLNWLDWSIWIDNSTLIAMAAEALLSSLAIAYRIRLLSDERDVALAQEVESRRLSEIDPLTGLLNRRAFLAGAIGRAGRQMLLLVDIDHFKRVNDAIGHDGGDEVLRVFARTLRQAAGDTTLVARLGGEEFALVADCGATLDPHMLIERLRLTRMPFDMRVTASIGLCSGPLATEADWKRLYQGADRALFEAKAQGRDRIRSADMLAAVA